MSPVALALVIPGAVLAIATLTASIAALFRVAKLRVELEAAQGAATAWKEERDAAVAKAGRLEADVEQLQNRVGELERLNKQLQDRTDLTLYFSKQEENQTATLDELHEMTKRVGSLATAIETLAVMLRPFTAAT